MHRESPLRARRPCLPTLRWLRPVLFVSAACAAPNARAQMVPASDDTPMIVSAYFDSTLTGIAGDYTIAGDSMHRVTLRARSSGVIEAHVHGMWQSAGLFDGSEFRGVLRELDSRYGGVDKGLTTRTGDVRGALRFKVRGDGRIEAEVDPGSGSKRKETWTRAEESDPAVPPLMDSDPDLPRFGEMVKIDELPEAIERVTPYYPEEARRNNIHGTVMVQALVGRDGEVKDLRIVKGIEGLNRVAAACVWLWRFKPAMAQGKPKAVWVAVPVKFTLTN